MRIVWKSRFGRTFRYTETNHGEEGSSIIIYDNIGISLVRVRKQELGYSGCVVQWSGVSPVFCIGIRTNFQQLD